MNKRQLDYFISTDKYNLLKEKESKLSYFITKFSAKTRELLRCWIKH